METSIFKRILAGAFLLLPGVFLSIQFSCQGPQKKSGDRPHGTFSISGAFALYPLTVKWVEEFRKDYPDVQVDVSAGGAGKGMADVLANMVDLGMFSREVTPAELEKGAWYIAVAKDAVVPTLNSANPFKEQLLSKGLSRERGFYFGEEGGILNAIIGSIYLSLGATFLAFIIVGPLPCT